MTDSLTPGQEKRRLTDAMIAATGTRRCSSCAAYYPAEEVKLYRSLSGKQTVARCKQCNDRRKAAIASR